MARNKRNESALRPGPILTALALCSLFVVLGVGYVWYKNQIDLLGHQIKEREVHLADLERQNQVRREQLATLCSPVALDAAVKRLNLGLVQPDKSQVVWMVETMSVEQPGGDFSASGRQAKVGLAERKN